MQPGELRGEFGGGEASLAVEIAQVVRGGMVALVKIAFHAAGNQVAVGLRPERARGTT